MIERAALPKSTLEYVFPVSGVDLVSDRITSPPGSLSRCVGVDGRFRGKLKRFPGLRRVREFGNVSIGSGSALPPRFQTLTSTAMPVMEQITLQLDRENSGLIRGWVYYATDGTYNALVAEWYRDDTDTWSTTVLDVLGTDSFSELDIAYDHRSVFVCGVRSLLGTATTYNKVYWFDGTQWLGANMAPGQAVAPNAALATQTTGGYLKDGQTYSLFARVIVPEHGLVGRGTTFISTTISSAGANTCTREWVWNSTDKSNFLTNSFKGRKLQMYRTLASNYSNPDLVGPLYLEKEYTLQDGAPPTSQIADESQSGGQGAGTSTVHWGLLSDEALVLQPRLAPEELQHFTEALPRVSRVCVHERSLFTVSIPNSGTDKASNIGQQNLSNERNRTGLDSEVYRWSQLNTTQLNSFPVGNRRRPEDLSARVQDLVETGPFLALVTENSILRFHKSGSSLSRDPLHNRYGSSSRWGIFGVGSTLFIVAQVGLLVCDLTSGALEVIKETQHLFDRRANWRTTLPYTVVGYDSRAGYLVVQNTAASKHETLFLWLNDGVPTLLKDSPFEFVTTGVDPEEGGHTQAFFMRGGSTHYGITAYTLDVEGDSGSHLMNGGNSARTYNGTVVSSPLAPSTTSITLASGLFEDLMEGFYIRFFDSDGLPRGAATQITRVGRPGSPTVSWATGSSGNWETAGAWNTGVAPTTRDFVGITASGTYNVTLNGNATIQALTLGGSGSTPSLVLGTNTLTFTEVATTVDFGMTSFTPAAGNTFAIAAIPFQVTAWPLSGDPQQPLLDLFRVKKTTAMQAFIEDGEDNGIAGAGVNNKLIFQAWGRSESTPLDQGSGTLTAASTSSCIGSVETNRNLILPGVEQYAADCDFSLVGVLINATLEGTIQEL